GGAKRVCPALDCGQLLACLGGPGEQLLVGRAPEAALRFCDAVELALDVLEPVRLGLERREEGAQLRRGLAKPKLDVSQLVAGSLELAGEMLQRSDGAFGDRDET